MARALRNDSTRGCNPAWIAKEWVEKMRRVVKGDEKEQQESAELLFWLASKAALVGEPQKTFFYPSSSLLLKESRFADVADLLVKIFTNTSTKN